MRIPCRAAAACFFLLAAGVVNAQTITPEEFAKHAETGEVSISPTGEYLAMVVPVENGKESQLQVMKMDGTSTQVIRFGFSRHFTNIIWSDDYRLVVSKATKEFGEETPHATGELMAVDVDGKNQEMLFGDIPDEGTKRGKRHDVGYAEVVRVLDKEPGFVLVGYTSWEQRGDPDSVVYKVDTHTGARREVERVKRADAWAFDHTGRLRVLVTLNADDLPEVFYRPVASSEMVPMPKSLVGYRTYGGWFSEDGNTAYLRISDQGEPEQLYRVDMVKGTREKVAGNPDQEIAYAQLSGTHGTPFAVGYDAGKPSLAYVDPTSEWAKLHAGLMKLFAGQLVYFINYTKDNQAVLFTVSSDRNPGAYYLYDLRSKKIQLISESQPWLKPERLLPMSSVEFKAKDGTKLYGFYTASGASKRPLIVMPHGGPIGISDHWGYDSDAQFLASRGYGVLQVNYRGSSGRGKTFEVAGWTHWGDQIQDDIADGVRWAIGNGLADGDRVCIYGASFGGYSALMNPIRNPGMYKCAIAYAGVYDINLWRKDKAALRSESLNRELDRTVGNDPAALTQISPAFQAAKIDVPVFLVHGKADNNVKVEQYRAMEAALKQAGKPYETMLVDGEGHGFYNPKNIAELYRRMEIFLAKNIGGSTGSAGGSH